MIIDYSPTYSRLNKDKRAIKGDFMYVASFDINGDIQTHTVQIFDFRQEFNPFYGRSVKAGKEKYFDCEYEVALVSYRFKSFIHKFLDKKTPVYSDTFWVDNVFFQPTRKEAIGALLNHIKSERCEVLRAKFEIDYPGFLEDFKFYCNRSFTLNRHDIISHFDSLNEDIRHNEAQSKIQAELVDIK